MKSIKYIEIFEKPLAADTEIHSAEPNTSPEIVR